MSPDVLRDTQADLIAFNPWVTIAVPLILALGIWILSEWWRMRHP